MKSVSFKEKMEIETFDGITGGGNQIKNNDSNEIPLSMLFSYQNHPFKVEDDKSMLELVESIKNEGILSPIIVRKRATSGYEILSGHRRKRACELAGIDKIPAIVKDLDDNEATILMVDSNIQRENILPSERAFSLKMKMQAIKKQGRRTDLTSDQVGPKLASKEIGKENEISSTQVKRYIRLTMLIPIILEKVDSREIGFNTAVELSYIDKENQELIYSLSKETNTKITFEQAKLLRRAFENAVLNKDTISDILNKKHVEDRSVSFSNLELNDYFPDEMDSEIIKSLIISLIKQWKEGLEDG